CQWHRNDGRPTYRKLVRRKRAAHACQRRSRRSQSVSMATSSPQNRPEFMVTLGLLPPYSAEDIKAAYFEKARAAHPDLGGTAQDFIRLQDAYQKAVEYA